MPMSPLFLMDNIKMDRIPTKFKWKINTCPFYILFQVLKVIFIKICKIHPLDLLFLVFVAFTSEDIIFHKGLELHSTLSEKKKKIFVTNFPFLTDSLNPHPHPLNNQSLLSMTKVFCWCSLMCCLLLESKSK